MEIKVQVAIIAVLALVLSLSGCINYEQETFLNEDRSGHINMHISVDPKAFLSNLFATAGGKSLIKEPLSKATSSVKCDVKEEDVVKGFKQGAVKNMSFRKEEESGIMHFYFSADFDDITALYTDENRISISEDKDGRVTYTERFSSSDTGTAGSGGTDAFRPELFEGYHFQYILHMPRNIVSANTDRVDKNTATWYIPMPDAMQAKDFTATATIESQNKFLKWRNTVMKKKTL